MTVASCTLEQVKDVARFAFERNKDFTKRCKPFFA